MQLYPDAYVECECAELTGITCYRYSNVSNRELVFVRENAWRLDSKEKIYAKRKALFVNPFCLQHMQQKGKPALPEPDESIADMTLEHHSAILTNAQENAATWIQTYVRQVARHFDTKQPGWEDYLYQVAASSCFARNTELALLYLLCSKNRDAHEKDGVYEDDPRFPIRNMARLAIVADVREYLANASETTHGR